MSIWRVTKLFRHLGSYETFLSTMMAETAFGGLCKRHAEVGLHHAEMALPVLAAQLGMYMIFFWNLEGDKMIITNED